MHPESLIVEIQDGARVVVERKTWGSKEKSFSQFPLQLGYALTIHKAQGMTCKELRLELDGAQSLFAEGQGYVALSRAERLDAVTLSRPLRVSVIKVNQRAQAFKSRMRSENGHFTEGRS